MARWKHSTPPASAASAAAYASAAPGHAADPAQHTAAQPGSAKPSRPRRTPSPPPPPPPAPPPPQELYLQWAQATEWRNFKRGSASQGGPAPEDPPIRIIAQAPDPQAMDEVLADIKAGRSPLTVPSTYSGRIPGTGARACHFTATLKKSDLPWLEHNRYGLRWELSVPLRAAALAAQIDPQSVYGPGRSEASLDAASVLQRPRGSVAASGRRGKPVGTVAVIDFGCPFLNLRFADGQGHTRVAALWDQDESRCTDRRPWWQQPESAGHGRELDRDTLRKLCDQVHGKGAQGGIDESAAYRDIDYLTAYDDARRRTWFATHGAHVLDLAGGRIDPLASLRPQPPAPSGGTAPARAKAPARDDLEPAQDAAGRADLVFVQLPALTTADSSGGSLAANLLDGVRYVLDRCDAEAPVVLNISYGTFAGPHDGSSLIEQALDELLVDDEEKRRRNFAIVLGAGNARRAGCHVRRTVRKDRSVLLRVMLQPGDTTDTFVEVWYPRPAAGQPPLQARARTAGRDWSGPATPGQPQVLEDEATRQPVALLQHAHAVMHGQQALVLLALAPTAHGADDEGPLAEAGVWEIELAFVPDEALPDAAAVPLDAWVERDDPGDSGQGAQPQFVGLDRDDERNTLSSIATGRHTVVVGGWRLGDGEPAAYSSLGALGASSRGSAGPRQPDLYAVCEEDDSNPSLAAAAVRSNDVFRMNGTSVAAPVLARRLFNAMVGTTTAGITVSRWQAMVLSLANGADGFIKRPAAD